MYLNFMFLDQFLFKLSYGNTETQTDEYSGRCVLQKGNYKKHRDMGVNTPIVKTLV